MQLNLTMLSDRDSDRKACGQEFPRVRDSTTGTKRCQAATAICLPAGIHFIHVNDTTVEGRRRQSKVAKSHVSRVNRRKTLEMKKLENSPKDQDSAKSSPTAKPSPRSPTLADMPRTLSPVFGALTAKTFAPGLEHEPAEVLSYFSTHMTPNWMSPQDSVMYFQAYAELPMLFHALNVSAAYHQDFRRGVIEKSNRPEHFMHKIEAIRHVNKEIARIETTDVEMLIFTLLCLLTLHPGPEELKPAEPLLFRPHMPQVGNLNVFGRMGTDTFHRNALQPLLDRIGGWQGIKSKGLAKRLAGYYLRMASSDLTAPTMPNVWTRKHSLSNLSVTHHLSTGTMDETGRGFVKNVPGGLPAAAVVTFLNLCAVDNVLSIFRSHRPSPSDLDIVRDALNDAHYRVMALPAWEDLSEAERGSSYLATYECCRLTAMLYSNAVIFPLPTLNNWHRTLLRQIKKLLQTSCLEIWAEDTVPLLVWCLSVSVLASYRTEFQTYFEGSLRDVLVDNDLTTRTIIRDILRRFAWTDSACQAGCAARWSSLGLSTETIVPVVVPPIDTTATLGQQSKILAQRLEGIGELDAR